MEGRPRGELRALREAQGIAPRLAEPRERDRGRPPAPDVVHDEAHGPSDGGVRLPTGAERAEARVHPDRPRDGAAHHDERGHVLVRGLDAPQVEGGVRDRPHRREHDRQVLRPAAGHDRVDRDLLDGGEALEGVELGEDRVRGASAGAHESASSTRPKVGATMGKPSVQPRR